jgi:hypothetical protein
VLYIDYARPPGGSQGTDGHMDHVGLYVGARGIRTPEGKAGDVVHASQSRGGVYPSTLANGWTHAAHLLGVDYGGITHVPEDTAPPAADLQPDQCRVRGDAARLRKAPALGAGVVALVPPGTVLTLLDYGGDWTRVRYDVRRGLYHEGYIRDDLLQFTTEEDG